MIRKFIDKDIKDITRLANVLHLNYEFNLNIFSDCLVYELNGNVIGFIVYSIIYERAEIIDIVVDKKYNNNGYGTNLLNEVISICKSKNCINITLEVNRENKNAINFYSNNGFEIINEISNYYRNIEYNKFSNAYIMKLDF